MMNIPNRSYWSTPERRPIAIAKLKSSTCWFAAFVSAFIVGVHLLVIQANTGAAPHLPNDAFFTLLGAFVLGLLAWLVTLFVQFRRPG